MHFSSSKKRVCISRNFLLNVVLLFKSKMDALTVLSIQYTDFTTFKMGCILLVILVSKSLKIFADSGEEGVKAKVKAP